MSLADILNVVVAGLLSLGAGGAIIVGLSSWLGKVWANRLMESERAKYAQDLESFVQSYSIIARLISLL